MTRLWTAWAGSSSILPEGYRGEVNLGIEMSG